jgi:energy-coupling factor transport system ATP-binding protein
VLDWDHVTVDFGARRAVDDVSLSVAPGEWVALIGANGSGKSTLTGLSAGLGRPTAGSVRFRGRPISSGKVFAAARNVALLLQAADEMLFAETVLGELEFGTKFRALPPDPVLDVAGAMEFFGFRGREQDSPWELSQGGRQRLALAAILVGAPGVLVLDEPTTGQDADHMRAFLALLDRVRERTGLTVLTVTHDIRGVASRASRVVLLGEGRVRADGPTARVLARTAELERWGVLAPPLARLQAALAPGADVLLDADSVAAAALAHRGEPASAAGRVNWEAQS